MWFLYTFCFIFSAYSLGKYLKLEDLLKFLKIFSIALSFICIIGLFKYFILGLPDANPWPLLNRNATIFALVPFIPLVLALKDINLLRKHFFFIFLVLSFLTLSLIFSRTGLIGLMISIIGYICYISRKKFTTFIKIFLILLIVINLLLVFFPKEITHLSQRLTVGWHSLPAIFGQEEIEMGIGDWRREVLIKESIRIFKDHWLLGTGIGLENYLFYFDKNIPTVPARPHCFYISYLAEFGILGFSFIILFLGYLTLIFLKTIKYTKKYSKLNCITKAIFVGHLSILIMLFFNEYITSPFIWFYWALSLALVYLVRKEIAFKISN